MSTEKSRTEQENQERSFFEKRIYDQLGVTEKMNEIMLTVEDSEGSRNLSTQIFSEDKDGNIDILVYTLDKKVVVYDKPGYDPKTAKPYKNGEDIFYITRLKEPIEVKRKDGSVDIKKYNIPKGAGTYPFFPPMLLEKFQAKEKIKTLVLTEGYFKAFKGCMHDIPTVGLSSITHYRDKETKEMYTDVLRLVMTCQVENIIILYDGDCRQVSTTAIEKFQDLYKRPGTFLSSVETIRELLKDTDKDIYFAHVNSENAAGKAKGLDDLFIAEKENTNEIKEDLLKLSKNPYYFYRQNITNSTKKLYRYFAVNNVNDFYSLHSEAINGREFVFRGSQYCINDKDEIEIKVPADAKDYFRVGTLIYRFVLVPNKYKQLEKQIHKWDKGTLTDDFGKGFIKHIPKYLAFCNVPDHNNFAQVINNCFNTYHEFEWEPEEGECNVTLDFIKHIFEEHYELGLDYIQLLYQRPTQILPILCLVSKENNTGKSTFIKYMKQIFGQNSTIIGNTELNNDFNASYASKVLIMVEESFIEKKQIVEKIKALSTADKIMMNAKGRDHIEIDFFGKFLLASNNEKNFIYATTQDIRYWVRKIKKPNKDNPKLMTELIEEIPAFLNFLNKRKMYSKEESRMWFNSSLIVTEALKRLQENSKPEVMKTIINKLSEAFKKHPPQQKKYSGDKHRYIGIDVPAFCANYKGIIVHFLENNYSNKENYVREILLEISQCVIEGHSKRNEYLDEKRDPIDAEKIEYEWRKDGAPAKPYHIIYAPDVLTDDEMDQINKEFNLKMNFNS